MSLKTTKVLLIRLRRIGDVVLTTPAVGALKGALPESELVYVVEEPYRRLVEGHPDLGGVFVLEKKAGFRGFLDLVRRVRKERFDAVVDFHGGPKASWLAYLSGAPLKIGYETGFRNFIYGVRVPRRSSEGPIHSAANHINLVRPLGADPASEPPLRLPPATSREIENVRAFFRNNGLSSRRHGQSNDQAETRGKRAVVLHIGAGTEFRAWGAASLTRLAAKLLADGDVGVVLIGGEEDRKTEAGIMAEAPETLSLVGRLNLIETRELISRAALFAGPDSGPMHIATEAATPIVAWFGPTLPAHFAPWKPAAPVTLIEKNLACRPCRQKKCIHGDFRCLRTITVDEVHEACRRLLDSAPNPRSA